MSLITISSFDEFQKYHAQVLGYSEYHTISQDQINKFAEATLDYQWIHVDQERAKTGPFGTTIAHGYLTLSLVPFLWEQILEARNLKMMVNYGLDNLKYGQPVPVNSEIRLKAIVKNLTNLRGICKAEIDAILEIKGNPKPAFTSTMILLYHFNS
jgi:acyl dehydratase